MSQEKPDVLIIGGGITGCGVAREAALRGLTALLVEKNDLASGTSSRSTKLLHGGLRYLEHGHLGLVREALREREALAGMAPHLARSLAFAVPGYRGRHPGRLVVRVGVALYDLMAGPTSLGRGRLISERETRALIPHLNGDPITGAVLFSDRQTDDTRLTLAVARDASLAGAVVRPRWEVVELLSRGGRIMGARCRARETGMTHDLEAEVVVNAGGPWADRLRALSGANDPVLRPSRGTHVVLPDLGLKTAVMLSGRRPGHRFFAIPWRGVTLLGTTDDDDRTDPDRVEPQRQDITLLLEEACRHFPGARLGRGSILSTFAGLRPLVRAGGDTLAMSREHRIVENRGMFTLVGGKLTTWRSMAEELVDLICRRLGRASPRGGTSAARPLPGGGPCVSSDDARLSHLPAGLRLHLLETYGSEAIAVAAICREDAGAAQRIVTGCGDVIAQVDFAVREEFALHLEDVILRRLSIGHLPEASRAAATPVAARMRRLLGWSAGQEHEELRALESLLDHQESFALALPEPVGA